MGNKKNKVEERKLQKIINGWKNNRIKYEINNLQHSYPLFLTNSYPKFIGSKIYSNKDKKGNGKRQWQSEV
jgi:hypothetical protein